MLAINKMKRIGQHFRTTHPGGDASSVAISSPSSEPATNTTTVTATSELEVPLSVSATAISSSAVTLNQSSSSSSSSGSGDGSSSSSSSSSGSGSSSGDGSGSSSGSSSDGQTSTAVEVAESCQAQEVVSSYDSTTSPPHSLVCPFPSEEDQGEDDDRVHKRLKVEQTAENEDTNNQFCCLF